MDNAAAYARVHERICSILDEKTADTDVATTPGWTVKDVVAHLAGFFTASKMDDPKEAFGPDWGDREVDARKDRSLQECITEWTELMKDPGDLFESNLGPVAVSDVLAHEQDIRNALGKPGGRDDENIVPAVEMALSWAGKKIEGQGSPTVKVVTEDIDHKIGEGEPAATLRTSTFELFRTVHGRRTEDQLRAMEWEGDPGDSLPSLFIFGPTKEKVEA